MAGVCVDCGKQLTNPIALRCRPCYNIFHSNPAQLKDYRCPDCGGKRSRKAVRCWECAARYKAEFGVASGHNSKARVSKTEINKAPAPQGVSLSSVIRVVRNGETFEEHQSFQRDLLIPISLAWGEPIQEIPLRQKKIRYDDEQELTKEETPTAKRLYRISRAVA